MKFFLETWYLFLAAAVSGAMLIWPLIRGGARGGSQVSANDAVQMINREKAVLIDVSEPAEYAAGHAVGARSVPFASLDAAAKDQPKDLPKDLPKNKALPLVVVCPTGSRAGKAVATLKALGFENARSLAGGLKAWRDANLPVERSAA